MKLRASLVATLLFLLVSMPTGAQRSVVPPPDMKVITVPFTLGCFTTVRRMMEYLWTDYGELTAMYLELRPGEFDGYIFTNEDNTTLSFVVAKFAQPPATNTDQVCIMWAGKSPSGNAIMPMIKPDPTMFPPRKELDAI